MSDRRARIVLWYVATALMMMAWTAAWGFGVIAAWANHGLVAGAFVAVVGAWHTRWLVQQSADRRTHA